MATTEEFIRKLLAEVGDRYEWGGEYRPGTDPHDTHAWDCSGLLYTKLNELGLPCPRSSGEIYDWCVRAGGELSLEQGKRLRGAILYMQGHIGVSLGDGRSVESSGSRGVAVLKNTFQRWTHAARVPGLQYGEGESVMPLPIAGDITTTPPRADARARRPQVSLGARGAAVRELQQLLAECGFDPGPIDGDFGARTRAAVLAFQRASGLASDGIAGPQTWSALLQRSAQREPAPRQR